MHGPYNIKKTFMILIRVQNMATEPAYYGATFLTEAASNSTDRDVKHVQGIRKIGSPFQRRVLGAVNKKFRLRLIGWCHSSAAGYVTAADTADAAL
jgi:hypothetical protein